MAPAALHSLLPSPLQKSPRRNIASELSSTYERLPGS